MIAYLYTSSSLEFSSLSSRTYCLLYTTVVLPGTVPEWYVTTYHFSAAFEVSLSSHMALRFSFCYIKLPFFHILHVLI